MEWQLSPYVPLLLLASLVNALGAWLAWRQRSVRGALQLALLGLSAAWWSVAYAAELSGSSRAWALFWAAVEYLGIVSVAVCWLLFALAYTGRERWLSRGHVAVLLAVPLLTLLAIWSNDAHRLFWTASHMQRHGTILVLHNVFGPLFWLHTAYAYTCLLAGSLILIVTIVRRPSLFRRSLTPMLAASSTPWVSNIIFLSGFSPSGYLDLTPLAFSLSSLIATWAIIGRNLFSILPIAHNTVFEQLGESVVVLDEHGLLVDANQSALDSLGESRAALLGRNVREVFGRWPALSERYRGVDAVSDEVVIASADMQRWLAIRIAPLYDRRGGRIGRLVIWRDVSQSKHAELALIQARDAAEAASRAKSAFLANMSHELRTPLTAIMGSTQLMRLQLERHIERDITSDLAVIEKAGAHLLQLINNLLQLSHIEAGTLTLERVPVLVDDLCVGVIALIEPLAAQRGNQLKAHIEPDLGIVQTDPTRLRQVLLNLLDNAVRFTEHGQVVFHANRERFGGRVWLTIRVSDSGVGMSEAELGQLFTIFAEGDSSKRRLYGGAGVGLAVSRQICRMLGGDIEAHSVVGAGSTFTIRLPVD